MRFEYNLPSRILFYFSFSVCNEGPCSTWWVDYWEDCSVTCGLKGIQSRVVECVDMVTEEYRDDCSGDSKPLSSRPCQNLKPCLLHNSHDTTASDLICLKDLISITVCKRYVKLCDRNSRFREKCCKTCLNSFD